MELKLFSIIRDEFKAGNYKPEHKYAFIEKIQEKYFKMLGKRAYKNLYNTAKKLQVMLNDFIILSGKPIVSDWDDADIEYSFLYLSILDSMIQEVGVIVKPIPMVVDSMAEEDIQFISDKLKISEDEIIKMNAKELSDAYVKNLVDKNGYFRELVKQFRGMSKDELMSVKNELMSMKEDLEINLKEDSGANLFGGKIKKERSYASRPGFSPRLRRHAFRRYSAKRRTNG